MTKVLILENNSFLHEYLEEFLKLHDCHVIFAHDVASVLAHAHGEACDVVYINFKDVGTEPASFIQSLRAGGREFKLFLSGVPAKEAETWKKSADAITIDPVRVEDVSNAFKKLTPLTPRSSGSQERVTARLLIVDDEEEICNFLAEQLEHEGFETYRAYNGQGAIDLAAKYECNLAIVDLKLPQIRGEDLVERWRQPGSTIREVIVVTGGIDQSIISLKRKGLTVLQKPVETDALVQLLLRLCDKHDLIAKKEADT